MDCWVCVCILTDVWVCVCCFCVWLTRKSVAGFVFVAFRSEERRVGKEC